MRIMVFSPHPDDDVIGCAGTIRHLIDAGHEVTVTYLTSGDAGDAGVPKEKLVAIREKEALEALSILGVRDFVFLRYPDGGVSVSPETLVRVTELIREKKPEIVFVPDRRESHKDHQAAYLLVMECVYRAGANAYQNIGGKPWSVETVLAYEVWTPLREPSYAEDISDVIETKRDAVKKHVSQLVNVDYDEAVIGLNRYRGAMTGKGKYAECFRIVRVGRLW